MDTIYSRLRTWRLQYALSLGVPTFFILSNAQLAGVALRSPSSVEELAACPGIGPKKLAQFGALLLDQVCACVAEGLEPGVVVPEVPQAAPLSETDLAEIMAGLRQELTERVTRRLKGRYSAAQVEEALSRLPGIA